MCLLCCQCHDCSRHITMTLTLNSAVPNYSPHRFMLLSCLRYILSIEKCQINILKKTSKPRICSNSKTVGQKTGHRIWTILMKYLFLHLAIFSTVFLISGPNFYGEELIGPKLVSCTVYSVSNLASFHELVLSFQQRFSFLDLQDFFFCPEIFSSYNSPQ